MKVTKLDIPIDLNFKAHTYQDLVVVDSLDELILELVDRERLALLEDAEGCLLSVAPLPTPDDASLPLRHVLGVEGWSARLTTTVISYKIKYR